MLRPGDFDVAGDRRQLYRASRLPVMGVVVTAILGTSLNAVSRSIASSPDTRLFAFTLSSNLSSSSHDSWLLTVTAYSCLGRGSGSATSSNAGNTLPGQHSSFQFTSAAS